MWRRLGLSQRIKSWSLTSLQHRLMKTGGRLVKHARYYWLLLAEGHLNRKLFGEMLNRLAVLCQEGDAVSIGAAGRELPRGKLGAVSAEWALAWPERLDQTDLNAGPAKIDGSNVNEVPATSHPSVVHHK